MKRGLYLKGGGAKGSFQAGALKALYDNGIKFDVIGGTSIGAMNGYFYYMGKMDELHEIYSKWDRGNYTDMTLSGLTVDNEDMVSVLRSLKADSVRNDIEHFYVNFCPVKDGKIYHKVEDLAGISDYSKACDFVKWSALLPFNQPSMTMGEFISYMKTHDVNKAFMEDLENHVYDGLNLDGGMANNIFIKEVADAGLDELYILGYNGDKDSYLKDIPYISEELKKNTVYVSRDIPFELTDTYMFTKDFMTSNYREGYEKMIRILKEK